MQILENPFVRSPTLDTVLMVERTIEEHSGSILGRNYGKTYPGKLCGRLF